jgi:thiol:disulfide interchange protein
LSAASGAIVQISKGVFKLMKRSIVLSVCLVLLGVASSAQGQEAKAGDKTKTTRKTVTTVKAPPQTSEKAATANAQYVPVHQYDDKRDAEQDIEAAIVEAQRTNKRILVEVGGLWCVWCRIMDEFFEKNPQLLAEREKNFIMLKVNFSPENKNETALARFPKITGYPHLFVLEQDGKLLHSQDTAELEEGKGYNLEKFTSFLKQWSSATDGAATK